MSDVSNGSPSRQTAVGEFSAFRGLLAVVALQTLAFAPLSIANAALGSPVDTGTVVLGSVGVAVVGGILLASSQSLVDRILNLWIVFLFAMVVWYLAVAAVLELVGVGQAGILILQAPASVLAFATALFAERAW